MKAPIFVICLFTWVSIFAQANQTDTVVIFQSNSGYIKKYVDGEKETVMDCRHITARQFIAAYINAKGYDIKFNTSKPLAQDFIGLVGMGYSMRKMLNDFCNSQRLRYRIRGNTVCLRSRLI